LAVSPVFPCASLPTPFPAPFSSLPAPLFGLRLVARTPSGVLPVVTTVDANRSAFYREVEDGGRERRGEQHLRMSHSVHTYTLAIHRVGISSSRNVFVVFAVVSVVSIVSVVSLCLLTFTRDDAWCTYCPPSTHGSPAASCVSGLLRPHTLLHRKVLVRPMPDAAAAVMAVLSGTEP
jgi:hypothetical protein